MSSILNKAQAHSLWQTAPTNRFSKAARRHAQVYLVDDASLKEVRGQRPDGVSVISETRVKSASLHHRSILTETKNWCFITARVLEARMVAGGTHGVSERESRYAEAKEG